MDGKRIICLEESPCEFYIAMAWGAEPGSSLRCSFLTLVVPGPPSMFAAFYGNVAVSLGENALIPANRYELLIPL